MKRPVPQPIPLTAPFWEAARHDRLEIQRCRACGHYNHPPIPQCPQCGSLDLGWEQVSGRGTIYGYTVMHQPLVAGFEDAVPYNCIAVELDEQANLLLVGNLVGTSDGPRVGLRVEVEFAELGEGYKLPLFHPES
jgi:uncharacterized OB-fold protein